MATKDKTFREMLDVFKSDTPRREEIEYIDIDKIDSDARNFYELSGLESLAANIELCGLQQPIRVRTSPNKPSRVVIVSGHRRVAALRMLVEEGKEVFREVACIREEAPKSWAMQELRLIFANNDTRKMTSADIAKQAERIQELLYELKEEGVEFPGRMRDHVAEACQVSKSKLARLKVIRENLIPALHKDWETNAFSDQAAYALARMPETMQKVFADKPGKHQFGGEQCEKILADAEVFWKRVNGLCQTAGVDLQSASELLTPYRYTAPTICKIVDGSFDGMLYNEHEVGLDHVRKVVEICGLLGCSADALLGLPSSSGQGPEKAEWVMLDSGNLKWACSHCGYVEWSDHYPAEDGYLYCAGCGRDMRKEGGHETA